MENGILIGFGLFLLALIGLDVGMVASLLRQGDERRQWIVYRASTWTLLITALSLAGDVIVCVVRAQRMAGNPFVQLSVMAMVYFCTLLYYKKRYGD